MKDATKQITKLVQLGNNLADALQEFYSASDNPECIKEVRAWDRQVNRVFKNGKEIFIKQPSLDK